MPLYDFQCQSCGRVFEVRASIKQREDLKPECPVCHSHDTEALITAGLVILNKPSGAAIAPSGCGCGSNSGSGCCG